MATQNVITAPTQAAMFLVLVVPPGSESAVRDLLQDLPDLTKAVGFRAPDQQLVAVAGIGADLWDRMIGAPRPAQLHPFEEIRGATHTAVATPGDVLLHLRGGRLDLCFELARILVQRAGPGVQVVDEVHGFKFFDNRDLLGFVNGTANPDGAEALAAALVGDEDPEHAGGSYVIVQKYLHDLDAWQNKSVAAQEQAVGRSKLDNIEFPDAEKANNAHIVLTTITDESGNELDIVRDNMPFGNIGDAEFGTYFIGYACDPTRTERMLKNMFIGVPPGNHDRLLEVSKPVTGTLFFVPSNQFLSRLPSDT